MKTGDGLKDRYRKEIIRILSENPRVERIVLFGSRAMGTFTPESDIDIVLYGDDLSLTDLAQLKQALEETTIPQKVDLLLAKDIEKKELWEHIKKYGVEWWKRGNRTRAVPPQEEVTNKNKINDKWKDIKRRLFPQKPLGSLAEIHDSKRIPVKKSDRRPGPYPYYGASGIVDYVDSYIFDGEYLLLAEDGENLKTQNRPIAFLAKGKFWVNNHAHILTGKDGNNTRFLCYALQLADIKSYLSGSTRPKLTQKDMRRIPLYAPNPKEQRAIAHILGTLDDKIELNREMNKTLEEMAQAIFKSWFVDFDPVVWKAVKAGKTVPDKFSKRAAYYKESRKCHVPEEILPLFPDSFADSELGPIPKGWKATIIGSEFYLTMGQSPPGSTYNEKGVGLPFFQGRRDFGFRYPSNRVFCTAPTRIANTGDTLVSVRAPVGAINMAYETCCVGRGVAAVRHKSGSRSYTYYAMLALSELFQSYEAEGTVFGAITKKQFENLSSIAPQHDIVSLFERLVYPIDEDIRSFEEEIRILTEIRDTLLPKLISGEVRVPDVEKFLKEAGL